MVALNAYSEGRFSGTAYADDPSVRKPLLLMLAAAIGCGGDGGDRPTGPVVPTARQPIVFVHGFGGSAADWTAVVARFKADGWTDRELNAASYPSDVSNTSIAASIRDRVDSILAATGWDKVDFVTFSMGSLSSRYYLKNLGGVAKVDAWVSIAGPNRGTLTASQCSETPCAEMLPSSAFLEALNTGDETPGDVRYATWWSPCDETIVPPRSTVLTDAVNTETNCLPHWDMFTENIYLEFTAFIAP
jgi:triacylglycerol lipase